MGRIYVYIAGPYSQGDVIENVRWAIDMAEILTDHGLVPFVPHLTALWAFRYAHEIHFWYDYDLSWLIHCDCLLRLPGESEGADAEVEFAKAHGMLVFNHVDDCLKWAQNQSKKRENCEWKYDEDMSAWETDCGQAWCLSNDGTLEENGVRFCHYCGRPIMAVAADVPEVEEDEDSAEA